MWRVYQIFNNPKLNIKVSHADIHAKFETKYNIIVIHDLILVPVQGVKDWHILILIFIITGFAVLLLILEGAVPYLRGSVTRERDQEHPSGKTVSSCI